MKYAIIVGAIILILGSILVLRTYDLGRLDRQDDSFKVELKTTRMLQLELIQLIVKDYRTEEDLVRIKELIDDLDRL